MTTTDVVPASLGRKRRGAIVRMMVLLLVLVIATPLTAQEKKDEKPKPDDTPSFRIGALFFADYTYTAEPASRDSDGNTFHPSAFTVSRAYINVFGTLNHLISFRITPESARETGTGSSLSGSQTYRLKFAYAQFNLDDWLTKGSFIRAGLLETPYIGWYEGIYRYRFQGTIMVDREGFLIPSDSGVAFHYNFRDDYGDIHAAVVNGEGFARSEANNEKAFEVRGTLRPLPKAAVLKGLKITAYVHRDNYVAHGPRDRTIAQATFENPRINAGIDFLSSRDRRGATLPQLEGRGYSIWATPKLTKGWELLLRHDQLRPDRNVGLRKRDIEGIAYWFAFTSKTPISTAILFDRDALRAPAGPVTNYGVKMLLSF